ncbi:MAG: hypothetical protein ACHQQS_09055 [Thermoanaerobaculales bacterium]
MKIQTGLRRERLPDGSAVVFLLASSRGIVNHGSSKGYAYSRGKLGPLFNSLDDERAIMDEQGHGEAFRAIGNGWYLEFEW